MVDYQRAYRARNAAKGLCRDCSNPALPGETRCALCNSKQRWRHREWYAKNRKRQRERQQRLKELYKAEGRCTKCSGVLDSEADFGYVTCITCRTKAALNNWYK